MAKYFFHCTDGIDLALDRNGLDCAEDDIFAEAQTVSRRMMGALPASFDWSGWIVCVYDGGGRQVAAEPFPAHSSVVPLTTIRRREPAQRIAVRRAQPPHRGDARLSA